MAYSEIFPALYGNAKIKSILGEDIAQNRFSHAYILEGPIGSGKKTAALQIAAAINCESKNSSDSLPCCSCLNCRKVLKKQSPDVFFINDHEHATIGVEIIRNIKKDLYIPPNDCDTKIYILEECERLTVQAQNALLLSLEEPPRFVFFILLTTSATALLPTIRSRAPMIQMQQFTATQLESFLLLYKEETKNMAQDKISLASSMANGTIGSALLNLSSEDDYAELVELRNCALLFSNCLLTPPSTETIDLQFSLVKKERQAILRLFDLVLSVLRDYILSKKSFQCDYQFFTSSTQLPQLVKKTTVSKIMAAYDSVAKARNDLAANGSAQLIISSLLLTKNHLT